ncbi:MAG: flavodoxin family protein [Acetobacter sp.]|nr:flavodoxin family protein [Acetobacter sp.]
MDRRDFIKTTAAVAAAVALPKIGEAATGTAKIGDKQMKVLLVNGSPHEKGCTYTALNEIAEQLKKDGVGSEIFWIGVDAIHPCTACGACRKLGRCVYNDKVNEFVAKAAEFDGFVLGSPVHYASASGVIVPFMDRAFYSAFDKDVFRHKPAAAIVSARRAGTTATLDQLYKYFGITEMPVISGRYWNMVHGNTPEQVLQDKEGMQNMRILAKNMAYHLKCKQAAAAVGIMPPEKEVIEFTNFIR